MANPPQTQTNMAEVASSTQTNVSFLIPTENPSLMTTEKPPNIISPAIAAQANLLEEVELQEKLYMVGRVIKYLHPAGRFATNSTSEPLKAGEPPTKPAKPANPNLLKIFCGFVKDGVKSKQ